MIWHTLGIEPRSRNLHPTSIAIRPRTHNKKSSISKDKKYGAGMYSYFSLSEKSTSSGGDVVAKPVFLKVNTPVEVTIDSKQYRGLVRWCGFIDDADSTMAGLELVI